MIYNTELRFKSKTDIPKWVGAISEISADFNLGNGRTVIDGKSLLGIYAIDISKNCTLEVVSSEDVSNKVEGIIESLGLQPIQ